MRRGKEVKNKGKGRYIIYTLMGFIILAAGAILAKTTREPQGMMQALPYIFIGIGAGIFGQNVGTLISFRLLKKDPKAAKQIEIEEKDERNTMIRNRAKAKAYDLMILVYGALLLAFGLMLVNVEVVLAMVVAYIFIVTSSIYYMNKFEKEM
jgi:dipeptide/tripeptide permease